MKQLHVTEADLHASVDGQLPPGALAEVQAWLNEHAADGRRLANYRSQNAALHAMFDPVMEEPVPARMTAMIASARPAKSYRMLAAAMIAALAIGAVTGWYLHAWQTETRGASQASIVRQAAVAHVVYVPEVRHPVEVGADQEAHLAGWLSKRLGTAIRVPHLGEQGFSLVGGRLLPGAPDERTPVAQFMYQDAKGSRLTLYVRTHTDAVSETAFRFAREKNIGVFYWVDQKLGYALSGEIEKAELARVANAVYKQLNP